MQTFLPRICSRTLASLRSLSGADLEKGLYNLFRQCISELDRQRLGKQRVEAMQMTNAILGTGSMRWRTHPCCEMWASYVDALKVYQRACIDEWVSRGYRNTMQPFPVERDKLAIPSWLGNDRFHQSHRQNLLRKDPKFYGDKFQEDRPGDEYWWFSEKKGGWWSLKTRLEQKSSEKKRAASSVADGVAEVKVEVKTERMTRSLARKRKMEEVVKKEEEVLATPPRRKEWSTIKKEE